MPDTLSLIAESERIVYRAMVVAALDELHVAQQRILALEAQLKAAREEIRRIIHCAVITEEAKNGDINRR